MSASAFEIPAITPPRPWADMAEQAPPGTQDKGPALLDRLAADLMMDPEWMWRDGRTLWWWGGPVPIGFAVDRPRMCLGDPTVRVSAFVHLVQDIAAEEDLVLEVLSLRNRVASTGAMVFDPSSRRVLMSLTHYAHGGNDAVTRLFPALALMAYTEALALQQGGDLAGALQGRPVRSAHPRTGPRKGYDDLLGTTHREVKPRGKGRNRFRGGELEAIADGLLAMDLFATGDRDGVTAEFPWSSPVPTMVAKAIGTKPSGSTALLQLLAQKHPGYGQGLFSLLLLPETLTDTAALRRANDLNRAEMSRPTGLPSWGAWSTVPDRAGRVVHTAFLPNAYSSPGLAATAANYAYLRSQWAQELLLPAATVTGVRRGEVRLPSGTARQPDAGADQRCAMGRPARISDDYIDPFSA